jgi:integrase
MPRKLERALSPRKVQTAGVGRHCDGGGLYLQVTTTKNGEGLNRSWVFRYRLNGKLREMGLGPLSTIGLSEARERARVVRTKRLDGIDPIDERRVAGLRPANKLLTFDQAIAGYCAEHEGVTWKNGDQRRRQFLTHVSGKIGKLALRDIDTSHVTGVLDPIWKEKPELASRLRGRIEAILDWGRVRGHRTGENPARWKGHLDHIYPTRAKAQQAKRERTGRPEHHPALPYVDLPAFMVTLRERTGCSAWALEFAILTAARTNEVLRAKWSEIDMDGEVWTVPANRMKMAKEHRVPLCNQAIKILRQMTEIRRGDFIFPNDAGEGAMSNMALLMLLRRMHKEVTVHGFRSTFRDWCAEQTNFPRDVCEQALAHSLPDATEAAYRRTDMLNKRRFLMAAWDTYCTKPPPKGSVAIISRHAYVSRISSAERSRD